MEMKLLRDVIETVNHVFVLSPNAYSSEIGLKHSSFLISKLSEPDLLLSTQD